MSPRVCRASFRPHPLSPTLLGQLEHSFQHTDPAMWAPWPSVLRSLPGLAVAPPAPHWPFPSGTFSTVLLSRGAPSGPHTSAHAVLCAWGALSFLVEATNSPHPSSVGQHPLGGNTASINEPGP